MVTLQGHTIYLRALEPEDLAFAYAVENDERIWEYSQTQTPFSRFLLKKYLENARQDIYEAKQLRLAICRKEKFDAIGLIDLFDFDPKNKRAGVGILVYQNEDRNQGVGSEALELLIRYSRKHLMLHQLYANIACNNKISIALFEKSGFVRTGIKKDWVYETESGYQDEAFYQLVL